MTTREFIKYLLDNAENLDDELSFDTFHPKGEKFISLYPETFLNEPDGPTVIFTNQKIIKVKDIRKKLKELSQALKI